jgi:hypothetical protein
VLLLLANPGYDATSTWLDHAYTVAGWPLAGLHADAPPRLHAWWTARLRVLVDAFGAQHVAQRVCALQAHPWASASYDAGLVLPSGAEQDRIASEAAARGAVLLVARAARHWLAIPAVAAHPHTYRLRSTRAAYVTPGNIAPPAWTAVLRAMA